jgi:hypothetical protein
MPDVRSNRIALATKPANQAVRWDPAPCESRITLETWPCLMENVQGFAGPIGPDGEKRSGEKATGKFRTMADKNGPPERASACLHPSAPSRKVSSWYHSDRARAKKTAGQDYAWSLGSSTKEIENSTAVSKIQSAGHRVNGLITTLVPNPFHCSCGLIPAQHTTGPNEDDDYRHQPTETSRQHIREMPTGRGLKQQNGEPLQVAS